MMSDLDETVDEYSQDEYSQDGSGGGEPEVEDAPPLTANDVYEESQAGVFDHDALDEYETVNKVPTAIANNADFVDWNTDYVKKMNPGDGATFWISNTYRILMIGESNRESGEMYMTYGNTDEGTLTMIERGSTFSSGSVEVSGSTNHDVFKALFGELSNKKVKFVD
jgi:hypothetical protein